MVRYRCRRFLLSSLLTFLFLFCGTAIASEKILVLRPGSEEGFDQAYEGLVGTLDAVVGIETLIVGDQTTYEDVSRAIDLVDPELVVLMDNFAVSLYEFWQRRLPPDRKPPPSVVLMTLYVENAIYNLRNVNAIRYEVQGVTSLNHLRSLMTDPLERVGVVYSSSLKNFFQSQQQLCRDEEIELVGIEIPIDRLSPRAIRQALNQLLNKENIDALWVFNDSFSLSGKNLRRGWAPILIECSKPILVGVQSLMGVGHLGVFPDHYGLGEQAGHLIHEAFENHWELMGDRLRPPIRVVKTVNLKRVRESDIKLNAEVLDEMDHIIQ